MDDFKHMYLQCQLTPLTSSNVTSATFILSTLDVPMMDTRAGHWGKWGFIHY